MGYWNKPLRICFNLIALLRSKRCRRRNFSFLFQKIWNYFKHCVCSLVRVFFVKEAARQSMGKIIQTPEHLRKDWVLFHVITKKGIFIARVKTIFIIFLNHLTINMLVSWFFFCRIISIEDNLFTIMSIGTFCLLWLNPPTHSRR